MRFEFPDEAAKWLGHQDKSKGTREDFRRTIQSLINAWTQDLQSEYETFGPISLEDEG
jgi:hypothetical protein